MLDHITITVSNFGKSCSFYDHALAPLGMTRLFADGDNAAGYGMNGRAFFWIAQQDQPASHAHIAFSAKTRESIVGFYEAALAHGGRDNGPPGPRPKYHDHYFAAFVFDPDGNNVEAVIQ
jgi:catechol 2,3-dioxygenase-like lactoylglutathione lyase family enzyme